MGIYDGLLNCLKVSLYLLLHRLRLMGILRTSCLWGYHLVLELLNRAHAIDIHWSQILSISCSSCLFPHNRHSISRHSALGWERRIRRLKFYYSLLRNYFIFRLLHLFIWCNLFYLELMMTTSLILRFHYDMYVRLCGILWSCLCFRILLLFLVLVLFYKKTSNTFSNRNQPKLESIQEESQVCPVDRGARRAYSRGEAWGYHSEKANKSSVQSGSTSS